MLHERVHVVRALSETGAELDIQRSFELPLIERGRERITLDAPVVLDALLRNVGGDLLLTGTVTTHMQAECARCLAPAPQDIDLPVEELIARNAAEIAEMGEEIPEGDDVLPEFYFIEGEHLDVGPIVVQTLLLGLPDKPLHSEDCQGLCPVCGANWNDDTCEHRQEVEAPPTDPRWDALKGLDLSE